MAMISKNPKDKSFSKDTSKKEIEKQDQKKKETNKVSSGRITKVSTLHH